ncbi:MAG: hypothetical protein EON95_09880 [Caulobacteraceae bacterium]|nr:MAG: hypothetical protein EON95_09880 [Caulobacteraceae bacterium]
MRRLVLICAAVTLLGLPTAALAIDANALDGTWAGAYECGQGPASLTLTLDGDANGRITGTFSFGPRPNNPYIAAGSFRLEGSAAADQSFTLNGVQWISQPYNYSMVGIRGRLFTGEKPGDPLKLFGDILGGSGCTKFYADKQ